MPDTIPISVVMPVYNREAYLRMAIESILNQTFIKFEFIIINDGSTDRTEEIILSYRQKDARIKYFKNDENLGNNITRNKGMKLAAGKYIAIMDSDDIAIAERLEIQYNYLEKHPETGILGGYKIFFDKNGYFLQPYPSDPDYLKSYLFFKNAVGQPTVMLRKNLVEEHQLFYSPEHENMGDYHLWFRATLSGIQIKSLQQVLLYYRMSESQIGFRKAEDRNKKVSRFFKERLALFDVNLPENDFQTLHNFITGRVIINTEDFTLINQVFNLLESRNKLKNIYNSTSFKAALFYFRLRLIKYYFLEYKKDRFAFSKNLIKILKQTGISSLIMFWENDGKFIGKTGRKAYKPFTDDYNFLSEAW